MSEVSSLGHVSGAGLMRRACIRGISSCAILIVHLQLCCVGSSSVKPASCSRITSAISQTSPLCVEDVLTG